MGQKGCASDEKKKTGYNPPHFRHELWNLYHAALSEEPTTNNYAESWHNAIQVLLKDTDMSLSSYITTLKKDYVARKTRLEHIRLDRVTVKRNKEVL